jgi:hypothetical protein
MRAARTSDRSLTDFFMMVSFLKKIFGAFAPHFDPKRDIWCIYYSRCFAFCQSFFLILRFSVGYAQKKKNKYGGSDRFLFLLPVEKEREVWYTKGIPSEKRL